MSSRIMIDAGGPGEQPPVEEPQRAPAEAPERREPEPAPSTPPSESPSPEAPEEDEAARQKRFDRLTWEKHELKRQRDDAIAEHNRWLEQMQRQTQPPPSNEYQRGLMDAEQRRVAQTFNDACDRLFERGVQEFGPEMGEARDRLYSVGYNHQRPDVLAAITQLPDGHRVYRELARDLDRAAHILQLAPIPMAIALARLSSAEPTSDRDAPVSRAREPVRRIGGHSGRSELPLDHPNMTVAEHIRRRDREERRSRIMR